MSTKNQTKINQLLQKQPSGTVMLSSWLTSQGYSPDLQKRYRKSGWLESIGSGAMKRTGDIIAYTGALYALQQQKGLSIHIGGKSALNYLGKSQYLNFSSETAVLFGLSNEKLPTWFSNYPWGVEIQFHNTSFLPSDLGMVTLELGTYSLQISGPARAMMECLFLIPENQELTESFELMESLSNLRPQTVQTLLENCTSIKVKRLFLFLAEEAKHLWFTQLDLSKIALGTGKRAMVKSGAYIPKYQITVPKSWKTDDEIEL
ncbi:type IV toxin-antitoxin system AbiEi family antitoxin [Algoriphagus namhaensis]